MISLVKQENIVYIKKAQLWLGFFVFILLFTGCKSQNPTISINGNTMGTTYSIEIIDNSTQPIKTNIIKSKIDSALQAVNQQMSTYIPNSEISRFNQLTSTDWYKISNGFYKVVVMAQEISRLTQGAFDITVGPVMQLWGFGRDREQNTWQPPPDKKIEEMMESIGFNNIAIGKNSIKKNNTNTQIDLNAIAKGYGIDVVFELLRDLGYTDILVEIGGEVRCSGYNNDGKYWKIGIDKPILDTVPGAKLQTVISLNNKALATSGNYRNYFIYNGELFSHTINPKTGYPVQNHVVSASVTAPNCMMADALATALMVIGKDGMGIINALDEVEAMIIIRTDVNKFNNVKSKGWGEY